MDIQQNQQYQQSNPQNRFNNISSLEALTEYAISALTEKTPSYFHESEKIFTKEIRNYGIALIQECKNRTLLELPDEAVEEAAENGFPHCPRE